MTRWTAMCGAVLLAACGGSSSPAGGGGSTVNGTVGSFSIGSVAEAISVTHSGASCQSATEQEAALYILLSSSGGHCAAAQSGATQPAGNVLELYIANVGSGTQTPIGPGTYTVSFGGQPAMVGIAGTITAAGCQSTVYLSGAGTVTISSVGAGGASGSYNLTFVDSMGAPAGTLTGSFTTSNCAIDAAKVCSAVKTSGC